MPSTISNSAVKDLINFYIYLKNKSHPLVKINSKNEKPTIIVIGAGIAGIAASKELTSHGLNVILIEARDRIGGRVHSLSLENDIFIELGAQFIHGIKNNSLYKISSKYNLEIKPYSRSNWTIYDIKGNEIDKSMLTELVETYKDYLKSLVIERKGDTRDRFLVEDLKEIDLKIQKQNAIQSPELRSLAQMISINEVNIESLFDYKLAINKKESESNFLVTNGFIKLLNGMFKDAQETGLLETHFSSEVTKINYDLEDIWVQTKNNEVFHGDALICTLPLGVLKKSDIFNPPLPQTKINAIKSLGFAIQNKVILEFHDVFWDNNLSHYVVLYDPTFKAWLDIINLQFFHSKKSPFFVLSVHSIEKNEQYKDKYILNHFVNLLKRIYPETFRPLKRHWVTHWDTDPFSLGSYSYHSKGSSLEDNSELAKPLGRLIFAGEHTHRSPSNIQGAYLSGMEGAKQVIEQLHQIYQSAPIP